VFGGECGMFAGLVVSGLGFSGLSGANSVVDFWVLEYSTQMKEKLKAGEKRS